jgi:D-sedoheptulose 7-phosphate isomerase
VLSAYANDVDPALVYAQLVYGYGKKGDLVIALSTSGNSKNAVEAVKTARALGIATLGFTGEKESALSRLCDVTLRAPSCETYRVQEYHLPLYHYLCAAVEEELFGGEN